MDGAVAGAEIGIVVAVAGGGGFAIMLASYAPAWPGSETARAWLALRHRLPWSLMDFLTDAHTRGVLRQEGAVYQFRHIELQHRLATRQPPVARIGLYFDIGDSSGGIIRWP